MAFTVEDGTGIAGANSYDSVANFKSYHDDRGGSYTGYTDTQIQQALVRATTYIDRRWRTRFLQTRLYPSLVFSRSVLTITAQPTDGETVTVGDGTATLRTTPTLADEAEIGNTLVQTLANIAGALAAGDSTVFEKGVFADPDVAAMAVFTSRDGIATTETLANGSFGAATSSGRSAQGQRLEFPRTSFGYPRAIREATAEYALRSLSAALAADPTFNEYGLTPTRVRRRVDVIEQETEFSEGAAVISFRPYPEADALLRPYVRPGGVVR